MLMDTIDPAKAARVWQRVQGESREGQKEQGLREMIAREWTDGMVFLQLSRRLPRKESASLRQLYEQAQAHTACLKGIYTVHSFLWPYLSTTSLQPSHLIFQ